MVFLAGPQSDQVTRDSRYSRIPSASSSFGYEPRAGNLANPSIFKSGDIPFREQGARLDHRQCQPGTALAWKRGESQNAGVENRENGDRLTPRAT